MNLDLVEILKNTPIGTKLYSPVCGEVEFRSAESSNSYPILVTTLDGDCQYFTKEGKYLDNKGGECLLFPSKYQRDWSKWEYSKPKKA